MTSILSRRRCLQAIIVALLFQMTLGVRGADEPAVAATEAAARPPSAVVCVASLNRWLENVDYVYASGGGQAVLDQVHGFLFALNDLKGINPDRPLGLLIYLSESLDADPEVLLFAPVDSMEDLKSSLSISERIWLVSLAEQDRWELRGGRKPVSIRVHDGHLFAAQQPKWLDRPLPDVAALTQSLAATYDVALDASREGFSSHAISAALDKLHRDAERDRAPRDGENETQHELRVRVSRAIEQLVARGLTDIEHVTLGVNLSEESRRARIEATLAVQPDSELTQLFAASASRPSQFAAVYNADAPLAMTSAWILSGEGLGLVTDLFRQARRVVRENLQSRFEDLSAPDHPARKFMDSVEATVASGRFDHVLSFAGDQPGRMVLVSGTHLVDADRAGDALQEILPFIALSPDVARLDMDAVSAEGVSLHRIEPRSPRKQDQRIYGPGAAFYVGVGHETIWLALGGRTAPEVLAGVIAAQSASRATAANGDAADPSPLFRLDLHLTPWLGLTDPDAGERERPNSEALRYAFNDPQQDGLTVRLVPFDRGLRLHVELEEGYIRLFGRALAKPKSKAAAPAE